jgi:sugar lactone lactonase YvrE
MQMKPDGELSEVMKTDDLPGGLGWLQDGSLLVVLMTKRMVYRYSNHHLERYADLSALAGFHCNDMLVDKMGRTWVGNFGYDLHAGEAIKPAEIIFIKEQGNATIAVDNVIFPNGMAINEDQKSLLVAETFASRISVFDISEDGMLNHAGVWADLKGAYPDGICLAADGTLWIAAPNIGQVIHIQQEGKVLDRVSTKGRPYACMLGGSELNILYITTSETDDPAQAVKQRSGRIEVVSLA